MHSIESGSTTQNPREVQTKSPEKTINRRRFLQLSGLFIASLAGLVLPGLACKESGGRREKSTSTSAPEKPEPKTGMDAINEAIEKGECPENPPQFLVPPKGCPTAQPFPTPQGGWPK